ncbi:type III polyketide synthase [Clavibacter tessellarius]|uniref:Type III polyketide synthase n=1 Tax=Clavibacter tessellarius TaxID=31965 RepID=A0A225CN91_9MICO|nr:type III polyketide synthase [Clavibacter michiganensis]OQJ63846.1 type III polyketide synthase [Clavibacter michiganensis subsp. tessellarius]UKF33175.1 type III polyketide synthase [Clavibacter michiganensis subsp. tessellarius]
MTASIRSIATEVPPTVLAQEGVRDLFGSQPELGRLGTRLVSAAFGASGIRTRHTVIRELGTAPGMAGASAEAAEPEAADEPPVYYDRTTGRILTPGTGARNDTYIREAPALLLGAARQAVEQAGGIEASDVTHVVTVSCTGFYAPGPDYAVVRGLGLGASTQRFHLGFMGCYGAFPALRMASQFCAADPEAVVLVVCVELCSLHLHSSGDADTIVASSVFGDGAAAAIVTARPAPAGSTVLDLDAFETVLTPVGEDDMAWTIGDQGFDMILSSYVPKIIDDHITGALEPLWAQVPALAGVAPAEVEDWAIHPGGRSILDRVEDRLALSPAQLQASRSTLAEVGNMSSATVLFVLARILHRTPPADVPGLDRADLAAPVATPGAGAGRVCAMAFGPGLTVETALMTRRTA